MPDQFNMNKDYDLIHGEISIQSLGIISAAPKKKISILPINERIIKHSVIIKVKSQNQNMKKKFKKKSY